MEFALTEEGIDKRIEDIQKYLYYNASLGINGLHFKENYLKISKLKDTQKSEKLAKFLDKMAKTGIGGMFLESTVESFMKIEPYPEYFDCLYVAAENYHKSLTTSWNHISRKRSTNPKDAVKELLRTKDMPNVNQIVKRYLKSNKVMVTDDVVDGLVLLEDSTNLLQRMEKLLEKGFGGSASDMAKAYRLVEGDNEAIESIEKRFSVKGRYGYAGCSSDMFDEAKLQFFRKKHKGMIENYEKLSKYLKDRGDIYSKCILDEINGKVNHHSEHDRFKKRYLIPLQDETHK